MANFIVVPALIRKKLAYFSLTACGINAFGGRTTVVSRFSYQIFSGDPQHHLIDSDNMLSANGYELTIPSTGYYEFHIQFGAGVNGVLQEMYVTRNFVNTGAVPNNTNIDDNIIMFVNYPVNTGIFGGRVPISACAMAHCNQGDVIRFLEGGVSSAVAIEGYKFMVRQLDQEII